MTLKRVTSGGVHLRDLAPGLRSSEETSQWWRAVGETASDLTIPGMKPKTSRVDNDVFYHYAQQLQILGNLVGRLTSLVKRIVN